MPRELSPLAVLLGVIVGAVFALAGAYIGLKVGMTVNASIPCAVISMAILRGLLKRGSILENNIVQTIGSAGESLAAGMIFTMPALFILADSQHDESLRPSILEMTLWGAIGGLIGVVFMIPLRRLLIVKEHGTLPYPEGLACAEVLQAGERGGSSARTVFAGLGVGGLYELVRGLGFWSDEAIQRLPLIRSQFSLSTEPSLLGVGYLIGARISAYMLAGAILGWFIIIPAIYQFGSPDSTIAPSTIPLSQMDPDALWNKYLRYIGAGAVVLGGIVSLIRSLGSIGSSIFSLFAGRGSGERTDRDLPIYVLLLILIALGAGLWYLPQQGLMHPVLSNGMIIACIFVFGFFFVTVSSRLVGLVGSSSNPASGMTIATILGTAPLILFGVGLSGDVAKFAIVSVGAFVCTAVCIAGDVSQDLKTGFLVKATPWKQQLGEIIGVLTASVAIAGTLWMIHSTLGFVRDAAHPHAVLAPQATLIKLLVQGVVDQQLPWTLIMIGVACALIVEMLGVPSLPFAVGLYLPLGLSTPIMVGGAIRWFVDRIRKPAKEGESPGVLAASGLVAGQGLAGVLLVGATAFIGWAWNNPMFVPPGGTEPETVIPKHYKDWLSYKLNFNSHYGLAPADGAGWFSAFQGENAFDLYMLLPLIPFALLGIWLLVTALWASSGEPEKPPAAPSSNYSSTPNPMTTS